MINTQLRGASPGLIPGKDTIVIQFPVSYPATTSRSARRTRMPLGAEAGASVSGRDYREGMIIKDRAAGTSFSGPMRQGLCRQGEGLMS